MEIINSTLLVLFLVTFATLTEFVYVLILPFYEIYFLIIYWVKRIERITLAQMCNNSYKNAVKFEVLFFRHVGFLWPIQCKTTPKCPFQLFLFLYTYMCFILVDWTLTQYCQNIGCKWTALYIKIFLIDYIYYTIRCITFFSHI